MHFLSLLQHINSGTDYLFIACQPFADHGSTLSIVSIKHHLLFYQR